MFWKPVIAASVLVVGWAPAAVVAKDGFSVSGSVRLRYETIDGQPRVGFNSHDELFNVRTQILTEYRSGPLRLGVELFDSRAYGANDGSPISTNEVNALEPVQAYIAADLGSALGKGTALTVTAGRMMLNLGSRRLVAADDYRNTTNGYTGLKADFSGPGETKATFIYTLPQTRLPDDPASVRDADVRLDRESFDYVIWGGLASKGHALGPAVLEASYFHLGERDAPGRPTRDRSIDTAGGRLIAEPRAGKFDYEVEVFYQWGRASASPAATATRQSVSAGFVHADLGYSLPGPCKPHLSAEFDWASGDRAGGRYGRFDTLFGMRRADLAPAGLYNALARTNILTSAVRLEASPDKRMDMFAVYRLLWLAAREDSFSSTGVRDARGQSGRFAGTQVEGRVRYWLIPSRLRFEYDGLVLAKGRFLQDAPNATRKKLSLYNSANLTISF